jgi:murein DD-endopeptidase MepM/ murein hydrolase activator NlpD
MHHNKIDKRFIKFTLALIITAAVVAYLAGSEASAKQSPIIADKWRYPMQNAYCTWKQAPNMSWGSYRDTGNSRGCHLGIDIASTDATVYAAASGSVEAVGSHPTNGLYILVRHIMPNGKAVYSFYCHLARQTVQRGDIVSIGAAIGQMGTTGASTGPHLHFAIVDTPRQGRYNGYCHSVTGNSCDFLSVRYYNPVYVIERNQLP